jgi:hypothetical protein
MPERVVFLFQVKHLSLQLNGRLFLQPFDCDFLVLTELVEFELVLLIVLAVDHDLLVPLLQLERVPLLLIIHVHQLRVVL